MDSYKREAIGAKDCQAIEEKYRLLGALHKTHEATRWRSYAARFPGAMREAEMCSDANLRARMRCARGFTRWIGQTRAVCLQAPVDRSVLLWHDLHLLLRDLQRWRARYGRRKLDLHHFLRWTQNSGDAECRRRWPLPGARLHANAHGRPCSSSALHWLATRAELESPTLLSLLVDRPGAARQRKEGLP